MLKAEKEAQAMACASQSKTERRMERIVRILSFVKEIFKCLKLFDPNAETSTRKFNINAPKADLNRDTVEAAMQAVVDSSAFEDLIGVVKGVLITRESEIIFEN